MNERALDERLAALEAARAWSPGLVAKLEGHIRCAEDEALFRINPFNFAVEKHSTDSEVVDLLIYAASVGIFRMDWLLLCPKCSCVVESFSKLEGVHNQYHCFMCHSDYGTMLDDYVAVSFTIDPQIREIVFHHPDRLSAWDFLFKVNGTSDGRLLDGTAVTDLRAATMKTVTYLPPGETTRIDLDAAEGVIFGVSLEGRAAILYPVEGPPATKPQICKIVHGEKVRKHTVRTIAPGAVTFKIQNLTGERGTFCLALRSGDFELGKVPLQFVPFLTAKRLLTTQTFRDLFRWSEVIRVGKGIGVRDITLLFTDLKGSTALYNKIGDLNAFALVQQHFHCLQSATVRHGGAVVKTIGDAVMAAFTEPHAAVEAAVNMLLEIGTLNARVPERELILKIGIHRGASIAVTLNDQLDYFGQTVNIAARVQALADANEIFLSQEIYEAPGVMDLLRSFVVEPRLARLRGLDGEMSVFRVASREAAGQYVAEA